jgi:outer membrane receptor protein involved in Fe transport
LKTSFRCSLRRALTALGAALLLAAAATAAAFEARLLEADGSPAAGYAIAVVGVPGSVQTGGDGSFRLEPSPEPPFTLVATSPAGETSTPLEVLEGGSSELKLPEVVRESVTIISGVAPSLDLLPGSVATTVTREALDQTTPVRLYQALESVAGTSKLGDGADSVPALRNLGRGRSLILIDGARVTAERRAGPSATYVEPFSLSSFEVQRGPGSVVYGSDAFGGVMNAVTRDPDTDRMKFSYGVEGSFEAADEVAGFAVGSMPVGDGGLLFEAHYRDAEEVEAGGGEEIFNSGFTSYGGAMRYLAPAGNGRLRLGLAIDRVDDLGKAAIDSESIRAYYPDEDSDRLTISWIGSAGAWDTVEASAFYGNYEVVLDRDRAATSTSNRRIDRADTSAKDGSLRFVSGREWAGGRLQTGADVISRFDLESVFSQVRYLPDGVTIQRTDVFPAIDDASQLDLGLFATWTRSLADHVSLGLGARGDYVDTENEGGFFGDRSVTDSDFSGNVALSFGPFADWTTTAQVARGFRSPTLSDRYFRGPSGRGFVIGNPDLESENSLQFDLGTRWRRGKTALGLFAYHYEIDNLIERYQAGDDFQFRNRGTGEIEGIEAEIQTTFAEAWSLESGLAVSDGWTDGGAAIDDIAPPNAWVNLRYNFGRGFALGRVATFLEHDEPGPTELVRPGYTLFDLGGGFTLNDALEMRLLVRNVGDKKYYGAADDAADLATGRVVTLSVSGTL